MRERAIIESIIYQRNPIATAYMFSEELEDMRNEIFKYKQFLNILNGTMFSAQVSGTGASITNYIGVIAPNKSGVLSINTGTVATNRAGFSTALASMILTPNIYTLEFDNKVPVLSDATNTFTYRAGFINVVATSTITNGVYFEYDNAVSGAFWKIVSVKASAKTQIVTEIPIDINTFSKFKIVLNGITSNADYYIDDVLVGSINTNIPNTITNTFGVGFNINKTVGVTSRQVLVHNVKLYTE